MIMICAIILLQLLHLHSSTPPFSLHPPKYSEEKSFIDYAMYTVALCTSDGLFTSLEAGYVTSADIQTVLPYGYNVDHFMVPMRALKSALEHSAASLSPDGTQGDDRFLQVSGIMSYFHYNVVIK